MLGPNDHNPLTPAHLEKLNQVLQMVPETARLIETMRDSKLGVDQAKEENDTQYEIAAALKRNFFPGKP